MFRCLDAAVPSPEQSQTPILTATTPFQPLSLPSAEPGSRGLFQNGRVERPNEPTLDLKARLEAISAKVVDGQALTSDEEDTLLFSGLEEL